MVRRTIVATLLLVAAAMHPATAQMYAGSPQYVMSPVGGNTLRLDLYGVPDGYGYATISGLTGVYDFVRVAPGHFYTYFIIPPDFPYDAPLVQGYFFAPYGTPLVFAAPLRRRFQNRFQRATFPRVGVYHAGVRLVPRPLR